MWQYLLQLLLSMWSVFKWITGINTVEKSNNNIQTINSHPNSEKPPKKSQEDEDPFEHHARFDREALEEITSHDSEMEKEILITFFESTEQELGKLTRALEQNNWKDAELYSHSIKGAAKYVGAFKVAERAYQIESLSKANKLKEVSPLIPHFIKEINETNQELKVYLDQIS